jgi:hypothetical protein
MKVVKRLQKMALRWLHGSVVHFLCHNPFFYKMACIYMLLTWHKNNNFRNLWLDLDCQFEKEDIYKQNCNIYVQNI